MNLDSVSKSNVNCVTLFQPFDLLGKSHMGFDVESLSWPLEDERAQLTFINMNATKEAQ